MTFKLSLFIFLIISITSCEKNDLSWDLEKKSMTPSVETLRIISYNNSETSVLSEVMMDQTEKVIQRGICLSLDATPTISNRVTIDGLGTGQYESRFSNLDPNTTYFVRAYAINKNGVSYGQQLDFKTTNVAGTLPIISTLPLSNITASSVNSGGDITSNGGSAITRRGICWSTILNPTVSDNTTSNGSGTGSYTSIVSNLSANTTYHLRAYATNSIGTTYGNQFSFSTLSSSSPQTIASLIGTDNCSSLSGVNSSYRRWNGSSYTYSPWTISNSGYSGSCWLAPDPSLTGTGAIGTHYVQFNKTFSDSGYIEFWLNTSNPGYNNIYPTIYIDGVAQNTPVKIGGQLSSFYFMQVRSEIISSGIHSIKIEFNGNYYIFKIDEIDYFEY